MRRDLTSSQLARQNILNNEIAISEVQKQTQFQGIVFEEILKGKRLKNFLSVKKLRNLPFLTFVLF